MVSIKLTRPCVTNGHYDPLWVVGTSDHISQNDRGRLSAAAVARPGRAVRRAVLVYYRAPGSAGSVGRALWGTTQYSGTNRRTQSAETTAEDRGMWTVGRGTGNRGRGTGRMGDNR